MEGACSDPFSTANFVQNGTPNHCPELPSFSLLSRYNPCCIEAAPSFLALGDLRAKYWANLMSKLWWSFVSSSVPFLGAQGRVQIFMVGDGGRQGCWLCPPTWLSSWIKLISNNWGVISLVASLRVPAQALWRSWIDQGAERNPVSSSGFWSAISLILPNASHGVLPVMGILQQGSYTNRIKATLLWTLVSSLDVPLWTRPMWEGRCHLGLFWRKWEPNVISWIPLAILHI